MSAQLKAGEGKRKRYVSLQTDRPFRLALKKAAADEGMSVSDYLMRLLRAARPDIEALAEKFERQ
jgi:hypothetical protein